MSEFNLVNINLALILKTAELVPFMPVVVECTAGMQHIHQLESHLDLATSINSWRASVHGVHAYMCQLVRQLGALLAGVNRGGQVA